MKMDVSKFKKVSSDKKKTVLMHPSGHHLVIAHDSLSKQNLDSLSKIPQMYKQARQTTDDSGVLKMADGGEAHKDVAPQDSDIFATTKKHLNDFYVGKDPRAEKAEPPNEVVDEIDDEADKALKRGGLQQAPLPNQIIQQAPARKARQPMAVGGEINDYKESLEMPPPAAQAPQALPDAAQMPAPQAPEVPYIPPEASTTAGNRLPPVKHYASPRGAESDPYAVANQTALGGIEKQQAGAQETASVLGEQGAKEASADAMSANEMNRQNTLFQTRLNDLMKERQLALKDVQTGHIDPQQFVKKMTTGDKIISGVGLLLSGFGSGLSGQPNMAYDYLNKQIDRDIDSQKANIHNKSTLLNSNFQATGNLLDAAQITKMQTLDLNAMHLKQIAAGMTDPLKKAELMTLSGQLDQKAAEIQTQIATRQALMQTYQEGPNEEAGFQRRMQLLNVMGQKDMADRIEKRHVPGVGHASREIPEDALKSITARNALNDAIIDLQNFGAQHTGSVNPATIAQGRAKAALTQDMVRQASQAGVFKESEKEFMNRYVGEDPTQLFQKYRSGKGYEEVRRNNQMQLNSLKETYGLPVKPMDKQKAAGTPTIQMRGGVPYKKVPGGWKKVK